MYAEINALIANGHSFQGNQVGCDIVEAQLT